MPAARSPQPKPSPTLLPQGDFAVVTCDSAGRITEASAGFVELMGYTDAEARGSALAALLGGPQSDPRALERMAWAARGSATVRPLQTLLYDRDGQPLWIATTAVPAHGGGATLLLADITDAKLHEAIQHPVLDAMAHALPLAEVSRLLCMALGHLAPHASAALLRFDAAGHLQLVAAPGMAAARARRLADPAADGSACIEASRSGRPVLRPPLDPGAGSCWAHPVVAADGQVLGILALRLAPGTQPQDRLHRLVRVSLPLCVLMLEREQARSDLSRLVEHDALTRLPHRGRLLADAERLLRDARRDGTPLTVAWIALDGREAVARALGEAAGALLLRTVAQRLQAIARPGDLVARLDGEDAFAVLLPQCSAPRAAAHLERLLATASQPLAIGLRSVLPQLRSGVATSTRNGCADGMDAAGLLHQAGIALVAARGDGGLPSEADLRAALADEADTAVGLMLHCRPRFAGPAWRALHGVQATLQWMHPRHGRIDRERLGALADGCGLGGALDRRALQSACSQLAAWRRAGRWVPQMSIALPAADLADTGLAAWLAEVLARHGLAPADLRLEVPEHLVLHGTPRRLEGARALGRIGVGLALRHFGAGPTDLAALQRLPVAEVQLDAALLQPTEEDGDGRATVATLLRVSHSLGLVTAADGVTTEQQLRAFTDCGCTVLQGDLLAPAMAASALSRWLDPILPYKHGRGP